MMTDFAPRSRTSAFTLIELLVVIAIIGILAALLFSVGKKAMESGKQTKALSVMKTLLGCASQYQADNGTYAYYRIQKPAPLGKLFFYQYFVTDYLNYDADALKSPFDTTWDQRLQTDNLRLPPTDTKTHYSYAMNISMPLIGQDPGDNLTRYPNALNINSLSKTAFFIECMGTTPGIRGASSAADLENVVRYPYRKGEATMVGYMDYHVDLVEKKDLLGSPDAKWTQDDRKNFWSGNL